MKFCLSQSPSKSFWRHTQWGLFILLVNWTMPGTSLAQTYPDKPIKFVVSFTAGGTTDILAREVANQLTQRWKVPVVVENKAGAAGNLGTEVVGRATPDGYTILVNSFGPIAINPTLFKSLNVNPQTELQPIALIAEVPTVLVVPTNLGINTMAEFMAYAKANAGKINYGSTGIGTAAHMTGYLYSLRTNINATHIPYKGDAPMNQALLSGYIGAVISPLSGVINPSQAGKLKIIATTGTKRSEAIPEVPTMSESGVPNFEHTGWLGLFAAPGTPITIERKIQTEFTKVLNSSDIKGKLPNWGYEAVGSTPENFAIKYQQDLLSYAKVIKDAHIELQD
jgi:tripartite-type tricarboxylate transporter receptor subunit TctC